MRRADAGALASMGRSRGRLLTFSRAKVVQGSPTAAARVSRRSRGGRLGQHFRQRTEAGDGGAVALETGKAGRRRSTRRRGWAGVQGGGAAPEAGKGGRMKVITR